MLTLHEIARRDALEVINTSTLAAFRADLKARCLELIQAEFDKSPLAQIGNLDLKPLRDHLDDGISDALWDIEMEIES